MPSWKDRKVNNAAELKVKGFKKRQFFSGWDNYTDAEKQIVIDIKAELMQKHGIDIDTMKPYGQRAANCVFTKGENKIVSGRDPLFED